jgi:uncharacterized protein
MLPALLADGEVTSDTMCRLAALLAAFHAKAESGPAIDHDGTVDVILGNWEENFTQARPPASGSDSCASSWAPGG